MRQTDRNEDLVDFGTLPAQVNALLQQGVAIHRTDPSHARTLFRHVIETAPNTRLKARIAAVYAERESLKAALEAHSIAPREGFGELERIDRELSDLDSRFKQLWDARHLRENRGRAVSNHAT
ncbi:MAG: hypothetical protein ACFCUG_14725 [Thiotrichales bacterium]